MTWQVPTRPLGRVLRSAVLLTLVGAGLPQAVQHASAATHAADHAVRADTIVQMLRFVEWNGAHSAHALRVAVVGNDGLAGALRDACATLQPAGRRVEVVVVSTPRAAVEAGAAVVVLGALPDAEARVIAARLTERGILTVGAGDCPDTPHLALNLLSDGPRYRVAANPTAAARAGVGLSSRLLRLAQIVGN